MTLLLSNILPSDRNANLPLQKYQLVCVVPTWVSMHMVQLISDTIYCLQGSHPQRHPVDLKKSNRALGFPALVTGLCRPYRAPLPPSKFMSSWHSSRECLSPPARSSGPPYQSSFHQEVLRLQAGAGRNTTAAWRWPAAGNRRTAITSRVHLCSSTKRFEYCLHHMADQ